MRNIRSAALALGVILVVVLAGTGATAAQMAAAPSAEPVQPGDAVEQTGTTTADNQTVRNETNHSEAVAPGARLSGVVGVQGAELESEVEERAFSYALNKSRTNESRASLIENETAKIEQRLQALESKLDQLEAARENDTIGESAYQAQVTTVSARINSLERKINQTASAGAGLPAHVKAKHNFNETRFARLHAAAGNLTGPEVAAIARDIAGPKHGHPAGVRGPPEHAGPNGHMGPPGQTGQNSAANTTTRGPGGQPMGPSENRSMGPADNSSMGPNQGPSNPGDGNNGNPGMGSAQGSPSERQTSNTNSTAQSDT